MEHLAQYRRPVAVAVLALAAFGLLLPYPPALRWTVPAGILLALIALAGFAAERAAMMKRPMNIEVTAFFATKLVAPLMLLAVVAAALTGVAPRLDAALWMAVALALVSLT